MSLPSTFLSAKDPLGLTEPALSDRPEGGSRTEPALSDRPEGGSRTGVSPVAGSQGKIPAGEGARSSISDGVVTKKKRVLLVDGSRAKRDLRSETMRKLGVEVDCAADISEARCWWRPGLYDLVLIHIVDDDKPVERFCVDVRSATPPQQTMFLVGEPSYLSAAPGCKEEAERTTTPVSPNQSELSVGSDGKPQRWGLLEACRRISEIRSVCDARTRAIRDRPGPRRDSEGTRADRILPDSVEFIKEELQ